MKEYLLESGIIDWKTEIVHEQANQLAVNCADKIEIARNCFEWVRDKVSHSGDTEKGPVTLKASEVLKHRTGFCYAKSHLLAALLRANGIPAGLCYQRLSINGGGEPYCLHGLNAVFLEMFGWYRIDPRGDAGNIKTVFDPPDEHLAYSPDPDTEADIPVIFADPLPEVVKVLRNCSTVREVSSNLPDIVTIRV